MISMKLNGAFPCYPFAYGGVLNNVGVAYRRLTIITFNYGEDDPILEIYLEYSFPINNITNNLLSFRNGELIARFG